MPAVCRAAGSRSARYRRRATRAPTRRPAERAFERLVTTATARRNGVLFFLVPSRRKFVVPGDEGIHEKVGQRFWDDVTAAVAGRFPKGDFTGGLVHGVAEAGRVLALHFPREDADSNELSDDVDFGEQAAALTSASRRSP
jgi:uncharacterized membrane protein